MSVINIAVRLAKAVRKVTYRKIRNGENIGNNF
jgi:hypothetical protein